MLPVDEYGDAVEYIEPVLDELQSCDDDKTALRAWRDKRLQPSAPE